MLSASVVVNVKNPSTKPPRGISTFMTPAIVVVVPCRSRTAPFSFAPVPSVVQRQRTMWLVLVCGSVTFDKPTSNFVVVPVSDT